MDWTPPIETGLSEFAYLEEQLEDHVDRLIDAHTPGVYVLECSLPVSTNPQDYERLWLAKHDVLPPFLPEIVESNQLLYVGAAKNVHARITEHLEAPNRSSAVTQVFPIHSVYDITFMATAEEAFDRETGIAMVLANDIPTAYVHSR